MQYITKLYYINLDHRTDRNEQFKAWLDESDVPAEKVHRINAVYVPGRGHLGCLASHIQALETFLQTSDDYCFIFEDDYRPIDVHIYWNSIQHIFDNNVDFDIILLAYNKLVSTPTKYPFLERVQKCYTSSGYLISRKFAPILLENFKNAFRLAVDEESRILQKTHQYCLDVYWEILMKDYLWYVIKPRIGIQVESFSDIEGHIVNHGV